MACLGVLSIATKCLTTTFIKEAGKDVQRIHHGSLPSLPTLDGEEEGGSCGHRHGYGRPHGQDLTDADGAAPAPVAAPTVAIAAVTPAPVTATGLGYPECAVRLEVLILVAHAHEDMDWCEGGWGRTEPH